MYDFSFIILPEDMNEKKGVFKSFMEKIMKDNENKGAI